MSDAREQLAAIKADAHAAISMDDFNEKIMREHDCTRDVPRLVAALEHVLDALDSADAKIENDIDDLGSAVSTTPDYIIERAHAMTRSEQAVVGKVRRAVAAEFPEEA